MENNRAMNGNVEDSNLTVALRIRPMSHSEVLRHATPIAHSVDNNLVVLMDPMDDSDDILRVNRSREKHFVFDVAFDAKATQEYVYEKTCKVLIPSVIGGYNATLFAYGATGAGKTHTMLGADDNPGIMAQALTELFYEMKRRDDHVFSVTMSYLEIYNEMIRDLLNPRVGFLDLREDHHGIQVVGLTEHSAKNTDQVMTILKHGNKQRTQEPTAANLTSSRSHAVLTISIRQRNHGQGLQQRIQVGKLYLIDLAGSERAANTKNRGKRMVEGAHINRSLLALGNCINALSDKSGQKYVNYRDSKLTRLLKDSLGGNCRTVMIAHISPASFHFEESRNTLVYADRAKHIKTKVRQNVVDMKMHISQYSNVISELQDEIKRLRQKLSHQQDSDRRSALPFPGEKLEHSDEDPRLLKLKKELVSVFHDQIELRQSLTELNSKEAGICLKMTKLQLLIKRHTMQTDHHGVQDVDYESPDKEQMAMFEVEQNRKELEALSRDKDRLDQLRTRLKKQLDQTNNRTAKLQEELSKLKICSEQREIVMLLARIQSLQLENARLNSAIVHQRAELYRADLFLSLQQDQGQDEVGGEMMRNQRKAIDDYDANSPHQLDYLQSAYKEEIRDIETYREQLLLPLIRKDQSLLSIASSAAADDGGRHRNHNNNAHPKSLSPLPERRLFTTTYTKHGISKDLEDMISLNSEFSTAMRSSYDINDNRKSDASWAMPRIVGRKGEEDNVSHRTAGEGNEMEQPMVGRYRQKVSRGDRTRRYSDDKSPLTVSRVAHHNNNQAASIASTSMSIAAAAAPETNSIFSEQGQRKQKPLDLDSLPEIRQDRSTRHRSRKKGSSSHSKNVSTQQANQKSRASLPAVNYVGQRKFSLQKSIYNLESDSSHAPSVMSEKAAILSRLNRHDQVKGSMVANGNNGVPDSIYNAPYRRLSVTPLHRKISGLPEPSFALHH